MLMPTFLAYAQSNDVDVLTEHDMFTLFGYVVVRGFISSHLCAEGQMS